jgi:hypothetical protein
MFRESKKGLKNTLGGYFSQIIQIRSERINTVSLYVAFTFKSKLERKQSVLIWSTGGEANNDVASYE